LPGLNARHANFAMKRSRSHDVEPSLSLWWLLRNKATQYSPKSASKDSSSSLSGTSPSFARGHAFETHSWSTLHRYKFYNARRRPNGEDRDGLPTNNRNSKACTVGLCAVAEMLCPFNKSADPSQISLTGCSDSLWDKDNEGRGTCPNTEDLHQTGICRGCPGSDSPSLGKVLETVTQEVQQGSPLTMFRGESDAIRLVTRYTRKHGEKYASWLLDDTVQQLNDCANRIDHEGYFAPSQMNNGLKRMYLSEQALPFALRIVRKFQTSQRSIPPVIRAVCKHFFEEFCHKYPAFSRRESLVYTVGRFLLLKLICPLVVKGLPRTGSSKLRKQMLTMTSRLVLLIGLGNTNDENASPPSLKKSMIEQEGAKAVLFWEALVQGDVDCEDDEVACIVTPHSNTAIIPL